MAEQVLEVPEVSCNHCVHAIEGAVGALSGVETVKVNLDRKDVTVRYDEGALDLARIVSAIEGEGYGVGADSAPRHQDAQLHQLGDKPSN